MKKGLFYIILSFILTLAVTEYLWIELLREEQVVAELASEKELEEDFYEEYSPGGKFQFTDSYFSPGQSLSFKNHSGVFAVGSDIFRRVVKHRRPKLFILHQQLRVHC